MTVLVQLLLVTPVGPAGVGIGFPAVQVSARVRCYDARGVCCALCARGALCGTVGVGFVAFSKACVYVSVCACEGCVCRVRCARGVLCGTVGVGFVAFSRACVYVSVCACGGVCVHAMG